MISVAEVRRIAGTLGVDPAVVDHDYVLGCFAHFLSLQREVQQGWLFKGGTSLRKCYFGGYRFSEDLDFTASTQLSASSLYQRIDEAKNAMQDDTGIVASRRKVVVETIQDEYGRECFEARRYYEGPWDYGGSPRSIRVHVNRDELVLFKPKTLPLIHAYSDEKDLPKVSVPVYALEETFVEKLRAISGQRRWAIARDIYDLHFLSKSGVDIDAALHAFPQKCAAKGISYTELDTSRIEQREQEYYVNWRNSLEYLVPASMRVSFAEAWDTSLKLLSAALGK